MREIRYNLTLLKKISGIRGTIGGKAGISLSPQDVVLLSSAYAALLKEKGNKKCIVIGRDARISGDLVSQLACSSIRSMGFDVVDVGLSTTPTVEMEVVRLKAGGGIILTASHNPRQWNALKLLNERGEFLSAEDGERMLQIADENNIEYADVDSLGNYTKHDKAISYHINSILNLSCLDNKRVQDKAYKVVVDCVNSTGAISIVSLLEQLSCEVIAINADMTGDFAHNPEPLPAHLKQLSKAVQEHNADLGVAVDPDVDRLVLVCEDGSMFGEEYTLVAAADYYLKHKSGPVVSNMSSSRALADIAEKYGQQYFTSAVGEAHVVGRMKEKNAVIGGEGNGGVILPELHYGRDALVGMALILNLLSEKNISASALRASYTSYEIIKEKIEIDPDLNIESILYSIRNDYIEHPINEEDGLRLDINKAWVHIRKSNTEPVIRIIAEAEDKAEAQKLIQAIAKYLSD